MQRTRGRADTRTALRHTTGVIAGGVVATAVDVAVLVALVHAQVAVPAAAFVGSAAGAGACFLFNKYVAFGERSPIRAAQLVRFASVAAVTAALMALLMRVVAVGFGVPYLLAKLVCAALVFVVWSLPAQRRLVFRPVA